MPEDFHKLPTSPGLPPQDARPPAIPPAEVPKTIGKYKIESLLEKGGMSILYLGTHPETKQPTTIKVLSPKYLSHPEIVQRFLKEAEIISIADHPNIVKLYGHGEWEGGLYIAMEFIQGISLRQYILQKPTTLKGALEIVIDIAYALCHLHTHGVIHRDLKPENILINELGVVKVIDFGIAQLLEEGNGDHRHPRQGFVGTPIYMSPEQRDNPEQVTYASDIYSLGIITYELVLGKLSHGQLHLSLMPKGIQKILSKALRPNPLERYQDIVDFIADLTTYLNSEELLTEKSSEDRISKTSEELRQAQMILTQSQAPSWPETEIGIATSKGIGMGGIYSDFFQIQEGLYGMMIAEPKTLKGAEGVVGTAILRGMARALCRLTATPVEMATILNDLVITDNMKQVISLGYLILSSKENTLRYLSCDYGSLLRIPAGGGKVEQIGESNPPIGMDNKARFHDTTLPWNVGDTLIMTSLGSLTLEGLTEKDLITIVEEHAGIPPQKMVEGILLKARFSSSKTFQSQATTLIAIKKISGK